MPISKELQDAETLLVMFSGFKNEPGLDSRFYKRAGLADVSKLLVFDDAKRKTLGGLGNEHPTFQSHLANLEAEISAIPHKKLVCMGMSAGGYPAILHGHLLKADVVIAFVPWTYLTKRKMKQMQDPSLKRSKELLDFFDSLPSDTKQFLDLKEVLSTWNGKTDYFINTGQLATDKRRAGYLQGTPHVKIVEHDINHHRVAIQMLKMGEGRLRRLVRQQMKSKGFDQKTAA